MKFIAMAAFASSLISWGSAAAAPAGTQATADPRDPAHPRYADCAPPQAFAKRFPQLTLKKALGKVGADINYESPSVIEPRNPVTGARVTSENLYARKVLGIARYKDDHTFAEIAQPLEGPRNYFMVVSNTNYSNGSTITRRNDVAEIYLKRGDVILPIPLETASEIGFCSGDILDQTKPCFSTAYARLRVDSDLFETLANADPQQAITATWKRTDGEMAQCPLYFSPLSFKATLLSIDEAHAKAAAKREKQRAQGF
ncbi:hypothetical protein [Porphyrobacter sp. YT40]|uniref:hypothetical protein n=1 Tax=Porphyrobacter sp. YT40 TaxID=2547601 RepID=UPI001143924C|nr:hypothetical protein [Porphyrobacter sp. YT40]QDH35074.1 hypothetical protein E2E27_12530 [Porphyrobacter sp. YT40]